MIRHPCFLTDRTSPACLSLSSGCDTVTRSVEDLAVAILPSPNAATPVLLVGQGAYAATTLSFPLTGTVAGWGRRAV